MINLNAINGSTRRVSSTITRYLDAIGMQQVMRPGIPSTTNQKEISEQSVDPNQPEKRGRSTLCSDETDGQEHGAVVHKGHGD